MTLGVAVGDVVELDGVVGGGVATPVGDGDVQLANSAAAIRVAIHRFTGLIVRGAATPGYGQIA